MQCCALVLATCRKLQTPQLWMEGTGGESGFFCSPKLPDLSTTILWPIVASPPSSRLSAVLKGKNLTFRAAQIASTFARDPPVTKCPLLLSLSYPIITQRSQSPAQMKSWRLVPPQCNCSDCKAGRGCSQGWQSSRYPSLHVPICEVNKTSVGD